MQSFKSVIGNLMLYLPSALSKVTTRSLLCYERLLSTRISNVDRVSLSLSRCPCLSRTRSCWWASFSAQRCCSEWVSQIRTYEIQIFFCCRVDSRFVTMSHSLRYSFQCSCVLRTVAHLFLLVSSISVHVLVEPL